MNSRTLLAAAALVMGVAPLASAQLVTRTQDVTVTVTAVDNFTVSGGAIAMSVGIGTTTNNSSATYAIQTNSATARSITAQITVGGNMPSGVTLTTNLAAPTTGTSAGDVTLTTVATPVVTAITNTDDASKVITYKVTATAAAAPGALTARTITYTLQ